MHKLTVHITVTALVTVNIREPVMCDIQSLSCGKTAMKVLYVLVLFILFNAYSVDFVW